MHKTLDKKWTIHQLKYINTKGDVDVTKGWKTFSYFFFLLITLILLKTNTLDYLTKSTLLSTALLASFAIILFYKLLNKSRNFLLYNIFYAKALKINVITIDDNLSPYEPTTKELERILIGENKNCLNCPDNFTLIDKITFFWIRKDKERDNRRPIEHFIPYLSLIVILYALKEKSFKLVSVIGGYFAVVGLFFVYFVYLLIYQLKYINHNTLSYPTISIIGIAMLILWYLQTTHVALKMVNPETYIRVINKMTRRLTLQSGVQIGKSYNAILENYDKESAVYIYDYSVDQYLYIDKKFLSKYLKKSHELIAKSVGALLTLVISTALLVFVEFAVNTVFQNVNIKMIDKDKQENIQFVKHGINFIEKYIKKE